MEPKEDVKHLGTIDLIVMFIAIGAAVAVGIYYAIVDRKKSVDNYYYGGRKMSPIAVGMSIAVTYISAITIIGFPAETYLFGTILFWFGVSAIIPKTVACIYYIPLIDRLRLSTINEYLELRFNRQLRQTSSAISLFGLIFYMGVTVYVPALALNAVTPLSLFATITITTVVCTTYTTLGGMKAVIWTDVIQTVAMVTGGLAAMIRTIMKVGGFSNVLAVSNAGGRRNFWKAALFSMVPTTILMGIAVLTGLAMYVYYEGCDPLILGTIEKPDQLLPYLVVDVFEDLPGMAGLFVAAAFSGTLSTVSSGLNSLAVLLLNDFILLKKPNLSETLRLTISKIIVGGLGILVMCVACTISNFDATIIRILFSINGCLSGPVLGVYTLGAFFPSANSKGAVIGQIMATALSSWISFGSLFQGKSFPGNLPLSTSIDKCPISNDLLKNVTSDNFSTLNYLNKNFETTSLTTASITPIDSGSLRTTLYAISFMYYGTISLIITVFVGYIASLLTGKNDSKKANPSLFIPILDNSIFPKKIRQFFRFGVPELIETKDKEEKDKLFSNMGPSNEIKKSSKIYLDKESSM